MLMLLRQFVERRWVLVLATGVLGVRLLVALAVVPPWQHPDEPSHLLFARVLAEQDTPDVAYTPRPAASDATDVLVPTFLQGASFRTRRADPGLERELLTSMAEHGWWPYYGRPQPSPLPTSLTEAGLSVVDSEPTLYYVTAAWVLRALDVTSLLGQLYVLRWISALLGIATLWCGWAGTRRLFGVQLADLTVLLLSVLPQFALVSTGVSPGPLVNLCGAVLWWQTAVLFTGDRSVRTVALVWLAALVGLLTKRAGIPLGVMAAGVTVLAFVRSWWTGTFKVRGLVVASAAMFVLAVGVVVLLPDEVERILRTLWVTVISRSMNPESASLEYFERFTWTLLDSAWFYAGWMRYPAPISWTWLVRGLMVVSLLGLGAAAWRHRMRPSLPVVIAFGLVAVQVAAIYAVHFRLHVGPQGQYLFPVLAPMLALFWIGLRGWWPVRRWPVLAAGLITTVILFDLVGWSAVLIPLYVG